MTLTEFLFLLRIFYVQSIFARKCAIINRYMILICFLDLFIFYKFFSWVFCKVYQSAEKVLTAFGLFIYKIMDQKWSKEEDAILDSETPAPELVSFLNITNLSS